MASLLIQLLCVSDGFAQWIQDGMEICTAKGTQGYPYIISAGMGTYIIAWWDLRNGNEDIYAQKIHLSGNVMWGSDGDPVCVQGHNQLYPQIASDGQGGAIVSWRDWRRGNTNSDPYTQRINSNGMIEWASDGVALSLAANHQKSPHIISDGSEGAIVTWYDFRSGVSDIYAQRVSSKGALLWPSSGVCVCSASGSQDLPRIAPDGFGGAIIVWQDWRRGGEDIYAQRIDGSGASRWTSNGITVCSASENQHAPQLVPDGAGGAVIVWEDYRFGDADIYAQKINNEGVALWQGDGIRVCSAEGDQTFAQIAADSVDGYVIAWVDDRNGSSDIYAQRIESTGDISWDPNGVRVCVASRNQESPQIISDDSRGVIIAWADMRNGVKDIYAQRIDGNGDPLWTVDGAPICLARGEQDFPQLVSDGSNGAIITWQDYRNNNFDIYAQRIHADGLIDNPCPSIVRIEDVPHDQGGKVTLVWNASEADKFGNRMFSHYSIWRSLPAREAATISSSEPPVRNRADIPSECAGPIIKLADVAGVSYAWEWIANVDAHFFSRYAFTAPTLFDSTAADPARHYFIVSAHTTDPHIFYDSPPDSGYSVDNLSPNSPQKLAGAVEQACGSLRLTWARNTEPDLADYAVYRDVRRTFAPSPAYRIATVRDTTYLDREWHASKGYHYKVAAIDIHGNESCCASLSPEQIAGSDPPNGPDATFLAQNYPNPFNPSTTIKYFLPRECMVCLEIFDISGRRVALLFEGFRASGFHAERWDGLDNLGNATASGIYIYRLTVGKEQIAKKMILMR
jgi:hypothetical protein